MRRLVLLLAAAFLVACDGDPGPATATPEVTSTAEASPSVTPSVTYLNTPTPTPAWTRTPEPRPVAEPIGHPPGTGTGIAVVDAVIEALVAGDEAALNDLIDWQVEPCVRPPVNDYGPPPVCQEGQPTGDPTQFIPVSACHGGYRTPPDEEYTFDFARNGARLLGVRGPLTFGRESAAHLVVFSTIAGQSLYAHSMVVGEDGVVSQELGCGFSPEFMWARSSAHPVVLAPPQGALYGYPPETRLDDGGLLDEVALAVALRFPAQLRTRLAPNEASCFAHIRISTQSADDCATTPDDAEEPAFVVSGCHTGVRTVEEFERALYDSLDHRPRLYGARRVAGWWDERASVVLVFARPSLDPAPAFAILLTDDGIVGFDSSCGEDAAGLWAKYDEFAYRDPLLPPWEPR